MVKKIQFDANLIRSKLQKWRCNKIARYDKPKSYVGGADGFGPEIIDNRIITVTKYKKCI